MKRTTSARMQTGVMKAVVRATAARRNYRLKDRIAAKASVGAGRIVAKPSDALCPQSKPGAYRLAASPCIRLR